MDHHVHAQKLAPRRNDPPMRCPAKKARIPACAHRAAAIEIGGRTLGNRGILSGCSEKSTASCGLRQGEPRVRSNGVSNTAKAARRPLSRTILREIIVLVEQARLRRERFAPAEGES